MLSAYHRARGLLVVAALMLSTLTAILCICVEDECWESQVEQTVVVGIRV